MLAPEGDLPRIAADILDRLRARGPRVHCVTNAVAQALTANLLLAAGAAPSMTISADEVGDFVATADALLVNLGTLDAARRAAIGVAIDRAVERGVRWMLDPVLADRSPTRAAFATVLVRLKPNAIHVNAQEFATLTGEEAAPETAARFAHARGVTVALTGATDVVADGVRLARFGNGHPWMAKITGMGCAGAALCAACLAVEQDPWRAVAAGLLMIGVAGEIAAEDARGPGGLAVGIVDALSGLDGATLRARARVAP